MLADEGFEDFPVPAKAPRRPCLLRPRPVNSAGMSDVTRLLDAAAAGDSAGDSAAVADLLPLVYDELRKLAAARMAAEAPGHTLDAAALVHEAYLRLVGGQGSATAATSSPPPRPCAASSSTAPATRGG